MRYQVRSTCVVHYCLVSKWCLTLLRSHGLEFARLLCPWDFPGKNTRVGCHFLLQGIFLTLGSNLHFLQWQVVDSLPLTHHGSPKRKILYSLKKKKGGGELKLKPYYLTYVY